MFSVSRTMLEDMWLEISIPLQQDSPHERGARHTAYQVDCPAVPTPAMCAGISGHGTSPATDQSTISLGTCTLGIEVPEFVLIDPQWLQHDQHLLRGVSVHLARQQFVPRCNVCKDYGSLQEQSGGS
jgi:hypothetical protein